MLHSFENYSEARWEILGPKDAIALIAYCYGKLSTDGPWRVRCELARDMMLALFCAGAPWEEIAQAADAYLRVLLVGSNKDTSTSLAPTQLIECAQLCLIFDSFSERKEEFSTIIYSRYINGNDCRHIDDYLAMELRLHYAALGNNRMLLSDMRVSPESPKDSLDEPIFRSDGNAFAQAIDSTVRNSMARGTRCARPDSKLFVQRVQGFQDFGAGFLHAGSRWIGQISNLKMPSPALDTIMFYPPNSPFLKDVQQATS